MFDVTFKNVCPDSDYEKSLGNKIITFYNFQIIGDFLTDEDGQIVTDENNEPIEID